MHTRHTYIAISNIDRGHPNDALVTIGIILIDFKFSIILHCQFKNLDELHV